MKMLQATPAKSSMTVEQLLCLSEIRKMEARLSRQKLEHQKQCNEAFLAGQQKERARIGYELNENINQILASAHLYLSLLTPEHPEFQKIKSKSVQMITIAIDEMRNLSREKATPDLKEFGLVGSIRHMVEDLRFAKMFNIALTLMDQTNIESLDPDRKIALFRIIQEQCRNIIKYSNASNMQICLYCPGDRVRLIIRDDGKGFDPKVTPRGTGLFTIYERTRLYHGKVRLHSAPGKGCSLSVNIPLL